MRGRWMQVVMAIAGLAILAGMVGTAHAGKTDHYGPVAWQGGDYIDCGAGYDFDLILEYEIVGHGMMREGKDGYQLIEHWRGTDTVINTETGLTATGNFAYSFTYGDNDALETTRGIHWNLSLPNGERFQSAGNVVIDYSFWPPKIVEMNGNHDGQPYDDGPLCEFMAAAP